MKKHIPNLITLGNLFCGCLAIVCAFNGNLVWSAYLVGIAAVLDFFDGFVARLLKVGGEMGKQLDSLADMVTFGVVPSVVMYHLMKMSLTIEVVNSFDDYFGGPSYSLVVYMPLIAFLITIFSALRLAKFNTDTRQTDCFIGVPTPANAILICSLPLIIDFHGFGGGTEWHMNSTLIELENQNIFEEKSIFGLFFEELIVNKVFLIVLTLLMSYLLVAELPLFALKFKNFTWGDNKIRYVFLIISLVLLIVFQFIAIPFIIFLYIILSIINNLINKTKSQ